MKYFYKGKELYNIKKLKRDFNFFDIVANYMDKPIIGSYDAKNNKYLLRDDLKKLPDDYLLEKLGKFNLKELETNGI